MYQCRELEHIYIYIVISRYFKNTVGFVGLLNYFVCANLNCHKNIKLKKKVAAGRYNSEIQYLYFSSHFSFSVTSVVH